MNIRLIGILLLSCSFLHAEEVIDRTQAYIVLGQYSHACAELTQAVKRNPDHSPYQIALIKVLARMGDEKQMLQTWHRAVKVDPSLKNQRECIEEMAWGVIQKGAKAGSPITRSIALIAASLSNSAQGVSVMLNLLSDSNAVVRMVGVELAGGMRDSLLQKKIYRMIQDEKNWGVRLEAIRSVGRMKMREAKPLLEKILVAENVTAQEKAAAAESLVNLIETAERQEVEALATSPRAALRLLCCEVIMKLGLDRDQDILCRLTSDSYAEVRMMALQALGVLGVPAQRVAEACLDDHDPNVAIAAAWLLTVSGNEKGLHHLKKWLEHSRREVCIDASGAVAASGKYGVPLAVSIIKHHPEPYARVNAAIGLLRQRVQVKDSSTALFSAQQSIQELWMWQERGIFKAIAPSTVKHKEEIPRFPEAIDSMARLEILELLAVTEFPHSQEAARQFLSERSFGVAGAATALLLTEGDQEALDIVRQLLDDKDLKIRVQAALVLAMWGRDESVIDNLQAAYSQADRQMKERILEGLGRVGSASSLPFLIDKFDEPHQNLRIIAAAAALQCANH